MNKISACMVVYNEEKNIKRCLESLSGAVDEIVIVHDGECRDKTLQICRQFTDKIFIRRHVGEAEPQRPYSFIKAAGDWIFMIDADEFLPIESRDGLRDLTNQEQIDGYHLRWKFFDVEKNLYCQNMGIYKAVLFRKSKMFFLGIPHSSLQSRGRVEKSELVLNHVYRQVKLKQYLTKFNNWAKIHADLLVKNFDQIQSFQGNESDWSMVNQGIKRYGHFWLLPLIFPIKFFMNIVKSKNNIKNSFLGAIYSVLLIYYYNQKKNLSGREKV
jgi:glycosyltransferase involved in cell wall biosynthesis